MDERVAGKIIKGVGGLYEAEVSDCRREGESFAVKTVVCRARGIFRLENITPLVGDNAELVLEEGGSAVIDKILPRKNSLIRPPVANLDYLLAVISARSPDPRLQVTDKLVSIAEYNGIEPVIIVSKPDLDENAAAEISKIYRAVGFTVFEISNMNAESIKPLSGYITANFTGKCAAFAGVSGVGKSTLMNSLFPSLSLPTSSVSDKIGRGRHTTRHVQLYRINEKSDGTCGYLADTPGFSMLDFEHFDFFTYEDLPYTFREFSKHIGECRYTKCSHTREEGCAILNAVRAGEIEKSRHDSYVSLYDILKNKKIWKK